jgi:signal transduction histidine kinase/ligand-binding sensor domain-containing protein
MGVGVMGTVRARVGRMRVGRTRALTVALLMLGVLGWVPGACALDPTLDVSQYAHTSWKIRDGFFKGRITAIAQTPDGYLWVGTEFGLLRFDGVRAVPWQTQAGEHLPGGRIRSLLAASDGSLWVGTDQGLASWKDGKLTQYPQFAAKIVLTLFEDHEGTVWAGTGASTFNAGRLCAMNSGHAQCYGEDGIFGRAVYNLYDDSKGNLWVGGQSGLWHWKPGPPKLYSIPDSERGIFGLMEDDKGALLIFKSEGVRQLVNGKVEEYPLPGIGRGIKLGRVLRDRNGGLWIATFDHGLFHVHQGRTDVFSEADGLSGSFVEALFEDREGSIWVGNMNGLDRFRDLAAHTIGTKQGLSNVSVQSVLAARDGSVWMFTLDGLNRWKDGQVTIYRKRRGQSPASELGAREAVREIIDRGLPDTGASLYEDDRGRVWVFGNGVARFENGRFIPVSGVPNGAASSTAGDSRGELWIAQLGGLLHLIRGSVVEQIPWSKLGHKEFGSALAADPSHGGVWVGFLDGGLAYLKDGQVRASYGVGDGLGGGYVSLLQLGSDGVLWAETEGGLSHLKNGRISTLSSRNGLPCDAVHWMMEDDAHSVWLYMSCGLVRIARNELDAWAADPGRRVQASVFDSTDGVRSRARPTGVRPHVAKTPDGKLWFLPTDGVSVIDPQHLPVNKLPPPVHIEQITADGKSYWQNWSGDAASAKSKLPALVRDLTIDYTALSLVAPEKVQFRYKLEGWDRDWQDVGTRRQAFYTNLGPRNYRFRVMACNNSGVWNEAGDTLDFSIAPAYYQTIWFRSLWVAAFLAALWGLYQLRLRQVAREFNAGLEARVNERTRIARELHDTMLQSFQGLLLRFQATAYMLPGRPEEARKSLEGAIDQAAAAITEGRDAVQGLRSSTKVTNDLASAITTLGTELAAGESNPSAAEFHVEVEGTPRDLHPILRDEVYRIAGEALRNAFKHAQAKRIEVEIRYDERQLRLRVRDDGKGIDAQHLNEGGRAGHYGLPGMRERAKLMGGKLAVWSELDSGTEVELKIPASRAYEIPPARRRWWLAEKLSGKETETKS